MPAGRPPCQEVCGRGMHSAGSRPPRRPHLLSCPLACPPAGRGRAVEFFKYAQSSVAPAADPALALVMKLVGGDLLVSVEFQGNKGQMQAALAAVGIGPGLTFQGPPDAGDEAIVEVTWADSVLKHTGISDIKSPQDLTNVSGMWNDRCASAAAA